MEYKQDHNHSDDENGNNDKIPDLTRNETKPEVVVASFTVTNNSESQCYNSVVCEDDYRNRNVNAIVEKWMNQCDAYPIKNDYEKSKVPKRNDYGDAPKHLSDFWKYPTVYQNITAYPILATHSLLANARSKNMKLNKTLQKQPDHHKLSVDLTTDKRISLEPNKAAKGSRVAGSADVARMKPKPPPRKNRSMNPTSNRLSTKLGNDSHVAPRTAQNAKNPSDQLRQSDDDDVSKSKSVLAAIRTIDCESNKPKSKPKKAWVKKLHRCVTSYRFTCIMFYTVLIAVIIACITAITYPILIVFIDE